MINLFNLLEELNKKMINLKQECKISDFRILLNANNTIMVYILSEIENKENVLSEISQYPDILVEFIDNKNDIPEDFLVDLLFSDPNTVNISSTQKRLGNLLNPIQKIHNEIPVVTFYSYKGGVGRSTTLASCASYLSIHHKKKIVILDCDFEAPGFTNFFLEDPSSPFHKNGLVEYFLDNEDDEVPLNNYYWEVSKKFSGEGEIYVFPAGNLEDDEVFGSIFKTHRSHYLNGLTRIDMFSQDILVNQFIKLFDDIKERINPDLILIDSRTGFNDIFGISAFRLSNLVIGFFGNNIQTKPGLNFFLDTLLQVNAPQLLVVNSIIPQANKRKWFSIFRDDVESYLNKISEIQNAGKDDSNILTVKMFSIPFNEVLNNIGTKQEDYLDYIELIEKNSLSEYGELFEYVNGIIDELHPLNDIIKKDKAIKIESKIDLDTLQEEVASEKNSLKQQILVNLKEKMPQLYAENIDDFESEYHENRYFYRTCMEDLFNQNKLLVLGNKGTGKSYIYKSLKNAHIVKELQRRANKTDHDYYFLHIIDSTKRIDTIKFDNIVTSDNTEQFFERFWTVYIWNAIMLESPYGYNSPLNIGSISDDNETAKRFKSYIQDDEVIISIENDLRDLDKYLLEQGKKQLVIIFDELDSIVKPHKWSDRVSPLINLCKKMNYSSIFPKLFLRSDLFEKISNINNKKELTNRSISIEWTREELFAYFFKLVLSHSKEDFFKLTKLYAYYPSFYINKVVSNIAKAGDQPPLDDYTLRHLSSTFFGKYADVNNTPRYGESYDWFFTNLKNANDTISLRPFIDLLSISVEHALKDDKSESPILPQYYYTHGKAREHAVQNHFMDLASEKGNEDLIPIFNYIRDKASFRLKKEQLTQREFFDLLDDILSNCELTENNSRDAIILLLEVNGIIRSKFVRVGNIPHKNYQFALLYKYYLGLKSKSKRHKS